MRVGDGSRLIVEYQVLDSVDDWVLGRFFFVVDGVVIGDPSDPSVDLKGCLRWLEEFVLKPRNRYEPGLFEMPKEQVFVRLGASMLSAEDVGDFAKEVYKDTYTRFHISHLGMSSFDSVILLLVKDGKGNTRLIWKDGKNCLYDAFFPVGEMEHVMRDTIISMKKAISSDDQ